MKPWYLYVIQCSDDTLYTGITTDVKRRLSEHGTSKGAKYTRNRGPFKLLHLIRHANRSYASSAEIFFKKKTRKQKLEYIKNIALPGEIVELTGRTTKKQNKYSMVAVVKDYTMSKYIKEGAAFYVMSDGSSGFSFAYRRIQTRDTV